jgi:immunity protein Imm1 of predicted polymorphic toxin system
MLKQTLFHRFPVHSWPDPGQLRPYFFDPSLRDWAATRGDCRGLMATEVSPNELPGWNGPSEVHLVLTANQFHGVSLNYQRFGGGHRKGYFSRGDLRRLREWAETRQGDLLPAGLFIPFDDAWRAVKEFIERDGALPECIEWVEGKDLPLGTFPRWGFDGDERVWVKR